MKCWECEAEGVALHNHHPVPRSRGGTKTIPLCESCHAKAHHRKKNMTTSRLTKEGLARARARGVKLGNPNFAEVRDQGRAVQVNQADAFAWEMKPLIDACHKVGIVKLQAIADHLNEIGKPTRRGGTWHPMTVKNLLHRLNQIRG